MAKRHAIRIIGATLASALAIGTLGSVALADDGGVMQRLLGHDGYAAMVDQMRAVLGNERADQMLANCDATMAQVDQSSLQQMMSGMGSMMGSR